jgi:hypothetical protein
MRLYRFFLILSLAFTFLVGCSTLSGWMGEQFTKETDGISAQGAIGGMETTPSSPLFSGDGGQEIRLAVLAPEAQGDVPPYLPLYIQGLLNNNFRKYSAITLIDRQNLDRIIDEQNIAADGRYSDNDYVTIGNLTNAQYFLFGVIQKLSGERYSLLLSVTGSGSGETKAYSVKSGTLAQLEGSGEIINQISADLLSQLGVKLTEDGRRDLLAGSASTVKAEAGLARGITAQAGGLQVEALFNYTQSIAFDPSQIEAVTQLNLLSSSISGGSISERIVNDIQARNRWLEVFKEATLFYNDHPPFEIIFDPNLMLIGKIDYVKNTANLGMRIALQPSEAGFAALNALLEGLDKTGKREDWGFSGWPLLDISPRTPGTVVFNGKRSFSYRVEIALLNEENKTLSKNSITLDTGTIPFSPGSGRVLPPDGVFNIVYFNNVKAVDLTPTLTIMITSVNGIPSRDINASGYMKVGVGDLEKREAEEMAQRDKLNSEAAARQALLDREAAEKKAQLDREAAARKIVREQEAAKSSAAMKAFLDKASADSKKGSLSIGASYLFTDNNDIGNGYGIEIGGYGAPFPFTSAGLEVKGGVFPVNLKSEEFDMKTLYINASPLLGLVIPLSSSFKLFADGLLEAGTFANGFKGSIIEYLSYGFDIGVWWGGLTLKYRGAWYDRIYLHSIGAALSM